MDELFNHKSFNTLDPPIVRKTIIAYRILHEFLDKIPKTYRYTLGSRIDNNFIDLGEELVAATYSKNQQKISHLNSASEKLDALNFLLRISWEIRILDTKKYAVLGQALAEIGRMLGGWQKQVMNPTHN